MQIQELPLESMLPRISLCRLFDTQTASDWIPHPRVSDFYELSYYLEGNGSVTINNNTYKISSGDIRFSKPGTLLYGTPQYKSYTVYFDFGSNNILYKNAILDGIPDFFHTNGKHLKYFERLLQYYNSVELSAPVKQTAQLLTILSSLFESIYSLKGCCSAVRRCIDYMDGCYAQSITLDTLSAVSGYSKPHILRLFSHDLGCSPHDYLTSVRMNHAKYLLTETNIPLNAIALECGFSSDSHFKTLFKTVTGITPGSYRSRVNE